VVRGGQSPCGTRGAEPISHSDGGGAEIHDEEIAADTAACRISPVVSSAVATDTAPVRSERPEKSVINSLIKQSCSEAVSTALEGIPRDHRMVVAEFSITAASMSAAVFPSWIA